MSKQEARISCLRESRAIETVSTALELSKERA